MDAILKKLLYKAYSANLILGEPEEFKHISQEISGKTDNEIVNDKYEFIIIFAKKQEELIAQFSKLKDNIEKDAVLWIAYPKGTSKKYKKETDIKRDMLQQLLKEEGYQGVSLISIDEDWSAMRFRDIK